MIKLIDTIFRTILHIGAGIMTKKPEPTPTPVDETTEESMKLNLDRETIKILIEDKIATGG